jgi:nucleotide-binding universal stress UspA family protein
MAIGMATRAGSTVVVLHVRERSPYLQVPPLETLAEARSLVDDAVTTLARAGVESCGVVRSAGQHLVARRVVEEAGAWGCDTIIVGSSRLKGLRRVGSGGVRERIVRGSALPVVVAPSAIKCRGRLSRRHVDGPLAVVAADPGPLTPGNRSRARRNRADASDEERRGGS